MRSVITLALFLTASSVTAASVTYRITGTVTELDRSGEFPTGALLVGDQLTAYLSVDMATPDASPNSGIGDYYDAVTSVHIEAGNALWAWGAAPSRTRVVLHDDVYGGEFIDVVALADYPNTYAVFNLENRPDAGRLFSDALTFPTSGFAIGYVDLFDSGPDRSLRLRATAVTWAAVPLPSALTMLIIAISALITLRHSTPVHA